MSDLVVRRLATWLSLACAATLVVTGVALGLPAFRASLVGDRNRHAPYVTGSAIDVDRETYSKTARTVLIFARASCPACQRSKDQFARLVAALGDRPDVRVLLLHPEAETLDREREYVRDLGLAESSRVAIDPRVLKIQQVPAVAVVDREGRILAFYEGILTEEARSELVSLALGGGVN